MTDNNLTSDVQGSEADNLLQQKEFGGVLRKARESAGLTITEVADQLLISEDIIKSLENSQAETLPAATFTQGYIRSYARILNLPANEIIDAYNLMVPDSKQVLTPQSVLPAQKSSGDVFIKIISIAFVFIAIIVLMLWIDQTDFKMRKQATGQKNDISTDDIIVSEKKPEPEVLHNNTQKPQQFDTIKSEFSDTVINNTEHEQMAPDQPDLMENENESQEKTETAQTQEENFKTLSNDLLMLSALEDSWCEIQDAEGKRLYYRLITKGNEVKVEGVAPFRVYLGNAPQVRVEVNHKIVEFDHLVNKTSNTASLNISAEADAMRVLKR